jgi:hypothetical protein
MSRTTIVRYRTTPEAADENARLVRNVYIALADAAPNDFAYATYRLEDGATFVHVAQHGDDANPLASLAAFAEFQRELRSRCIEPPAPANATLVGSYGPTTPAIPNDTNSAATTHAGATK